MAHHWGRRSGAGTAKKNWAGTIRHLRSLKHLSRPTPVKGEKRSRAGMRSRFQEKAHPQLAEEFTRTDERWFTEGLGENDSEI